MRPNGGEILVEVVRDLAEVVALGRLGGEAKADSRRKDGFEGLIDIRDIDLNRLPPLVHLFLADGSARQELLAPLEVVSRQLQSGLPALEGRDVGPEIGELGVHVLDGTLELEPIGPDLGDLSAGLGLGSRQVRLGGRNGGLPDRDLILEGLLVELDQQRPLLHTVVVVNQHPAHLT
jgi:hypothetical protein